MSKKEELIELLKALKQTNLTYKQIAKKLNININSLYTWINQGNISEKKSAYLIKQIQHHFPDEYFYLLVNYYTPAIEKEIQMARESGNTLA